MFKRHHLHQPALPLQANHQHNKSPKRLPTKNQEEKTLATFRNRRQYRPSAFYSSNLLPEDGFSIFPPSARIVSTQPLLQAPPNFVICSENSLPQPKFGVYSRKPPGFALSLSRSKKGSQTERDTAGTSRKKSVSFIINKNTPSPGKKGLNSACLLNPSAFQDFSPKLSLQKKKHQPFTSTVLLSQQTEDDPATSGLPWGVLDSIDNRYQIQDILGSGSFGTVFKAYDNHNKELVAVKVIRETSKAKDTTENQIKLLQTIKEKDPEQQSSIYRLLRYFVSKKHICLVFELLSLNLFQLLSKVNFHGLPIDIIRKFAIQLLTSLSYLKCLGIIHTDLKPENIALRDPRKTGIRLLDFGAAIPVTGRHFDYVSSRFYRAPEIVLGHPYGIQIDMWGLGCVLAELFIGSPLFPGSSEQQMIALFLETKGMPPDVLLLRSSRSQLYFTPEGVKKSILTVKDHTVTIGGKPLTKIMSCDDQETQLFCKFLDRLLEWDPSKRASPESALMDEWILHGLNSEQLESHKQHVSSICQKIKCGIPTKGTVSHESTNTTNVKKISRRGSTPVSVQSRIRSFSNLDV